jgi:endonuclease/exonuclease/phosphatase family metal-dependent hydrolase
MRILFVVLVLFAPMFLVHGQVFRVATWNLENAFDTVHDVGKDDYEFLPSSERKWHGGRYWRKLRGITQTIAAMELPALIGVQEVENDTVLRDLTRRTALWSARYRYLVTDSPDERGVDVGLLYNPKVFSLIEWKSLSVPAKKYGLRSTRDMLLASGIVGDDTLHVCVVHFPSRRNDDEATRRLRSLVSDVLANVLDSLKGKNVIVMGDFNAEVGDELFSRFSTSLYSLLPQSKKNSNKVRGTYYFRGIWGYLDHILVSPQLLPFVKGNAMECRFLWLLRTKKQIPHRTYGGKNYLGGLSDHLPLVVDIDMK